MRYFRFFLITFIICSGVAVPVENLPQYSNVAGFARACNIEPQGNLINTAYLRDSNEKSALLELIILLAVVSPRPLYDKDYKSYQGCTFDYSGRITNSSDMALRNETVWDIFNRLGLEYQKPQNLGLGMCPTIYQAESDWFGGYAQSGPLCVWSILVPCTNFASEDISDAQRRVLEIVETHFPEDDQELMQFEWFVSFSGEADESQTDFALFVSLWNALHKRNPYCFVPAGRFVLDKFVVYDNEYSNILPVGADLLLPNGAIGRIHFCGPRFGFYSQYP
jgi:hypothetical protein